MAKLSIEDLQKIKDKGKAAAGMRGSAHKDVRVVVHMGTCGIASGARGVMNALLKAVEDKNLDVEISQSGCIGICDREPIVSVIRKNEPMIRYGKVTPAAMEEIVESHLIGGAVAEKYLMIETSEKK